MELKSDIQKQMAFDILLRSGSEQMSELQIVNTEDEEGCENEEFYINHPWETNYSLE